MPPGANYQSLRSSKQRPPLSCRLMHQQREAAIAKGLDQQDRCLARLERDVGINVETLALFIRFWLISTPALPEPAAQAARAKASERWDSFEMALGRRLSEGPKLWQEIPEDVEQK